MKNGWNHVETLFYVSFWIFSIKSYNFSAIPSINQTGKGFGFFNDKTYTYNSKSGWLLLAGHKNRSTRVYATAFPISEYHILISSRVMLTAEHKWIMNGKPFDKNNCSGGR